MRWTLPFVLVALALLAAACGGSGGIAATTGEAVVQVEIALEGGQPVGGDQTIMAKSGQHVAIRITSDVPDEVHVHGYDVEVAVVPGEPAEIELDANLEGIFEIESHETETVVAKLVVEP